MVSIKPQDKKSLLSFKRLYLLSDTKVKYSAVQREQSYTISHAAEEEEKKIGEGGALSSSLTDQVLSHLQSLGPAQADQGPMGGEDPDLA